MEMSTTTLQYCSCSIFPLTQQAQPREFHLKVPKLLPFFRATRPKAVLLAKYSRWDSNAEEMGRPAKGFDFGSRDEDASRSRRAKRQWWSEDPGEDEEEQEEEVGIMEEVIDSIWILKVFRSYGWTLPAILLSLLLATGPKAFLIVMAFPLAQSAVTLVFNRLSGKKRTRPRVQTGRRRRRRKRPSDAASGCRPDGVGGRGRNPNSRDGNSGAQSWVNDDDFSTESRNGASSSFGGWEELDGVQRGEKSSRAPGRSSAKTEMGRRRPSSQEAPLLLRLLVSMFPFLGLWTKMFW